MADSYFPQKTEEVLIEGTRSEVRGRPLYGVVQDSNALLRERVASGQALRARKPARTRSANTKSDRVKTHSTTRQRVIVESWVSQPISCQIDQQAEVWGVTRSKAIALLVERGLMQDVFANAENILTEAVQRAVAQRSAEAGRLSSACCFAS